MKRTNESACAAVRFLNLINAIRALPTIPSLDPLEERILMALAQNWATGIAITVMQILNTIHDASPSTVHRRLKSLKQKGLIAMREDEKDNRTKYVEPTELANNYFNEIGKCMAAAAKAL
jgi:DNA-binding MarR family transcriptional regulator